MAWHMLAVLCITNVRKDITPEAKETTLFVGEMDCGKMLTYGVKVLFLFFFEQKIKCALLIVI